MRTRFSDVTVHRTAAARKACVSVLVSLLLVSVLQTDTQTSCVSLLMSSLLVSLLHYTGRLRPHMKHATCHITLHIYTLDPAAHITILYTDTDTDIDTDTDTHT